MTEHVHEWEMRWPEIAAFCTGCLAHLEDDEIVHRLNATERLSARDAVHIAKVYRDTLGSIMADRLSAYAAALEGKNEKS